MLTRKLFIQITKGFPADAEIRMADGKPCCILSSDNGKTIIISDDCGYDDDDDTEDTEDTTFKPL